jgi:hypothetical protein
LTKFLFSLNLELEMRLKANEKVDQGNSL